MTSNINYENDFNNYQTEGSDTLISEHCAECRYWDSDYQLCRAITDWGDTASLLGTEMNVDFGYCKERLIFMNSEDYYNMIIRDNTRFYDEMLDYDNGCDDYE